MGFKQLIIVMLVLIFGAVYIIGGSESISKYIEKYTDDHIKDDSGRIEKIMFFNIQYCNFTAKYQRALDLIERYLLVFSREENREKAQFLKAQIVDNTLDAKLARGEYQKYLDDFPDGPNAGKAKTRLNDLKNFY
jgi:outer membrane protein assembly factor BamD (BamD/ComL family)